MKIISRKKKHNPLINGKTQYEIIEEKATEDFRLKYELEAEKTALTAQREQALKDMAELGVDAGCLDYVFIPKDTEGF